MVGSLLSRAFKNAAEAVDQTIGWHRLPSVLGIPTLLAIRETMRESNLYDEGEYRQPLDEEPGEWVHWRSINGRFNDLQSPLMGSVGSRFGRNVPLACTRPEEPPDILSPDPFGPAQRLAVPGEVVGQHGRRSVGYVVA